ncbi:MAG: DUF2804 domain-containing protein [Acidimicrobiia bacterium]
MHEITAPVALCQPGTGRLNSDAVGWSRVPLQDCHISGRWPRKKKWNYWAFTSDTHLFSVTVSDLDYAAMAFVYLADFVAGTVEEDSVLVPLGRGVELPDLVGDNVMFDRGGLSISMLHDGPDVQIEVAMPNFAGQGLTASMTATYPDAHETLNVVIPWSTLHFQFTAKHNTLPARGSVSIGEQNVAAFDEVSSFACLDFGRGVWKYRSTWNWGAGSGVVDGRTIGLNLGGQWTNGTGMTENAICVDGRISYIGEDLEWQYDPADWARPWFIRAPSGAVDVAFEPFLEREAKTNVGLVRSEVHQMFGTYTGIVHDSDGTSHSVDGIVGWAEDHVAAW